LTLLKNSLFENRKPGVCPTSLGLSLNPCLLQKQRENQEKIKSLKKPFEDLMAKSRNSTLLIGEGAEKMDRQPARYCLSAFLHELQQCCMPKMARVLAAHLVACSTCTLV
jgi:hypothetical protein